LYLILANEFGLAHWKVTLIYGAAQLAVGALCSCAYPLGATADFNFSDGLFYRLCPGQPAGSRSNQGKNVPEGDDWRMKAAISGAEARI
jgi:hypothetical protein